MSQSVNLSIDSFTEAIKSCAEAGIDPNRLHTALTKVIERALYTNHPGTGTAEALAIAAMPEVVRALGSNETLHIIGTVHPAVQTQKIKAIKALRTHFDMGLKEAKDLIEAGNGCTVFDTAIVGFEPTENYDLDVLQNELFDCGYATIIRNQ